MAGNLTAMIAAAFAGSAVTNDPYFEYTTLPLPGNGTNGAQNNTFLDSGTANSGSGFPITRNGNTTQGTFSPFSQTGWGNYFTNASSGLYNATGSNTAIHPAASFLSAASGSRVGSIEAMVYITAYPTAPASGEFSAVLNFGGNYFNFGIGSSGELSAYYYSGSTAYTESTATSAVPLNQWTYVAAIFDSSNNVNLYVNGTLLKTSTFNGVGHAIGNNTINQLRVGRTLLGSTSVLKGYISNLRIVNGTAVTPVTPTTALTAITNTSLLTCQSNRFVDNSSNGYVLTVEGSPSVQAFSPFNPTSSWSAVTNGGSGCFDGNGDYLSVAHNSALNLGAGDFTVEFWFYNTTTVGSPYDLYLALCGASGLAIYRNSSNKLSIDQNAVGVLMTSTNNVPQGQWTHIAVTRSGTALKAFMNGVQEASVTNSTNLSGTSTTTIFSQGASAYCTGYGSDLRIVKGTAIYTADFTPPTAPLTSTQSANTNGNPSAAITGTATSLLLNFTNGGIYDATSKNDLETVGNAQISTTQSKFGGSSMYFDGTSTTWLTIPDAPLTQLGSGDFTLETWFYANTGSLGSGVYVFLVDTRPAAGTATNSLLLYILSGTLTVQVAGTNLLTYSSFPTGQWVHIALSRASGTLRLFVNGSTTGVSPTSASNSTDISTYVRRIGVTYAQNLGFINGYLQDFRVTKGYARYTSNFTPPTAAFPTL